MADDDKRTADELLTYLSTDEFKARCVLVSTGLRHAQALGIDNFTVEQIADELGLPVDFLLTCAAGWAAASKGEAVTFIPRGARTHDPSKSADEILKSKRH
jgi:hypothetical protein